MLGGKAAGQTEGGYRLDPGPSIVILTRLYRQLFEDAGRRLEDYLQFDRLDPFSRVLTKDGCPIDLPSDREACESLVTGVAAEDAASFRKLLEILDRAAPAIDQTIFARPFDRPWQLLHPQLAQFARHFDVKKTYKQLVDGMFRSNLLRAFFYGFPSYGGQTYDSKAPGALLIPYLMISEGVFYPRGGIAAIPEALVRLATELGVIVRTGAKLSRIEVEGKRVKRAILTSGERISADAFISNIDRGTVAEMLGRTMPNDRRLSYFTVHWGIRKRFPQLQHHTLFVPDDFEHGFVQLYRQALPPEHPVIYVNATSRLDPKTAPEGCENLFVVITTPAITGIDWKSIEEPYQRSIRSQLQQFGVSWSDDEVDFMRVQTPLTFQQRDGSFDGSLYGSGDRTRLFGLFPASNRDDQLKNLFYCGGSVQPGAGLPMVLLSGKFAAGAASKGVGAQ